VLPRGLSLQYGAVDGGCFYQRQFYTRFKMVCWLRRRSLFVSDRLLGSIWTIFVNTRGLWHQNLRNMTPSTQMEFHLLKSGYKVMKAWRYCERLRPDSNIPADMGLQSNVCDSRLCMSILFFLLTDMKRCWRLRMRNLEEFGSFGVQRHTCYRYG